MSAVVIIFAVASAALVARRRVVGWLSFRRRARELTASRVQGLPSAVLLLQNAIATGLSSRGAISVIGALPIEHGELGVVAKDFALVGQRLELGADLADAILSLEPICGGTALIRVLDVLRRAEIDGGGLATHLEIVLHDLRRERAQALDIAAQRLTVSLLFPLVLCILPAFVLLAVVPLLLDALSSLPG